MKYNRHNKEIIVGVARNKAEHPSNFGRVHKIIYPTNNRSEQYGQQSFYYEKRRD